TSKKGLPDF
ncbi:ribosomal large subunit pseudouridine synthase D, partial [Wolbachia pipientis wVitA]